MCYIHVNITFILFYTYKREKNKYGRSHFSVEYRNTKQIISNDGKFLALDYKFLVINREGEWWNGEDQTRYRKVVKGHGHFGGCGKQ